MRLDPPQLAPAHQELRERVRSFLATELPWDSYRPGLGMDGEHSAEFSAKLGQQGWLCMTIPVEAGGQGRTATERFVVTEELLAVGAPLAASWVADRQIAPAIHRHGTPALREEFIPRIARGECFFSLGMSEPNSGSDLASVAASARPVSDGWVLNGSKIWTTYAHLNDYAVVLCRTSVEADRHAGLSQFIVDLHSPGVTIRSIRLLNGERHFNEVHFENVEVPDAMVLGAVGAGWQQVTSELALERSGADRLLSTYSVLHAWLNKCASGTQASATEASAVGEFVARLWSLRQMSLAISGRIDRDGVAPKAEASLVKDMGTAFEQESIALLRGLTETELSDETGASFEALLAQATMKIPVTTIRGGTTEVLRTVAARDILAEM